MTNLKDQLEFLSTSIVRITAILEKFQERIENLEMALKLTQENQEKTDQDIYRIQQKL